MKGREDKHVVNFNATKVKEGEKLIGFMEGWIGDIMGKGKDSQHNGQFILTDQRACFHRKGLLGEVFETIPLSKITSVETLSRMGYRVLRLHTSHDELAFKTFEAKELFDKTYDKIEELRHSDHQGDQVPPKAMASITDQIQKLAELHSAGILSDEEFQSKKTELLGRM